MAKRVRVVVVNQKFIGRVKLYFTTGHSLLIYIPWFVTQTALWYYLLIESIPSLEVAFPNYTIFLTLFIISYPLTITLLGHWYMRRSDVFPGEVSVATKQNPFYTDFATALTYLIEDKNSEAAALLEKWTKR